MKLLIEEVYGKKIETIVFGGKVLSEAKNGTTLTDLKIKNMSTLQVTLRLHGGQ